MTGSIVTVTSSPGLKRRTLLWSFGYDFGSANLEAEEKRDGRRAPGLSRTRPA